MDLNKSIGMLYADYVKAIRRWWGEEQTLNEKHRTIQGHHTKHTKEEKENHENKRHQKQNGVVLYNAHVSSWCEVNTNTVRPM